MKPTWPSRTAYPGPLSRVLGIRVALYHGQTNTIVMPDGRYSYSHLADLLHTETAEVLAVYGSDFYAGMPALTRNRFREGAAYYIASAPEAAFLDRFSGAVDGYCDLLTDAVVSGQLTLPGYGVSILVQGETST
jgi:hypothetical protein